MMASPSGYLIRATELCQIADSTATGRPGPRRPPKRQISTPPDVTGACIRTALTNSTALRRCGSGPATTAVTWCVRR